MRPTRWLVVVTVSAIASFAGSLIYAGHVARGIDEMAESIATNAAPSVRHLTAARTALHAVASAVTLPFLDDNDRRVDRPSLATARQRLHDELAIYFELPLYPTERTYWRALEEGVAEVGRSVDQILARLDAGDSAGAAALRERGFTAAILRADAALAALVAFDADQSVQLSLAIQRRRQRSRSAGNVLVVLDSILSLLLLLVARLAARQYVRALEDKQRLSEQEARQAKAAQTAQRQLAERIEAVLRATVRSAETAAHAPEADVMLRQIVDEARRLADASFVALGVGGDPARPFAPFVSVGEPPPHLVSSDEPPCATGVLGAVVARGTVRVDDLAAHEALAGLPAQQRPEGAFLGVAIQHDGASLGVLCLLRPPDRPAFTVDDQHVIELLAAFAGVAIDNDRLYRTVRQQAQAREDMLAIVAHDLRNPLSAITLSMHQLAMSLGARGGDPQAEKAVETTRRGATRMIRMIDDLLTAARLESAQLSVVLSPEEIAPMVAEAIDGQTEFAAERSLRLAVRVPAELPRVSCDRGRILQVLGNLVGNAIKFTPPGGEVTVAVAGGDGQVRFSVADTGIGIPSDALAHVFDRYWQKQEDARRGTGLGLFIAKGIVESHHGAIWAESRVGAGTTFSFTLPVAQPAKGQLS